MQNRGREPKQTFSRRAFVGNSGVLAGTAAMGALAQNASPAHGTEAASTGKTPTPTAAVSQHGVAASGNASGPQISMSGVCPSLAVTADMVPARSECGIGALIPWANKLWLISYVSHKAGTGSGTGLYEIDENLVMRRRPESLVGTYANRMIHPASNQAIIGPHLIDTDGNVRTIAEFKDHRLTATMEHLEDPKNKAYFLTMEGLLFEADVHTLKTRRLFDLVKELALPKGAAPHFKGGHCSNRRIVVANNSYDDNDYAGKWASGRLAEYLNGKWTILEQTAFNEVTGRKNFGAAIFATGWDKASAILKVFCAAKWSTYRLPMATHCYDQAWLTEWPRIREVETERFLMNCQGMFYEMSPLTYEGKIWGVRPICTHLRMIPDYCSFRGFLVLGGNQVTPTGDTNLFAGQPQSGLWFGKTDDLWQFGKPKGWGGPWREKRVEAGTPSDPYLMTGFDQKVLHLCHDADREVEFTVEVDFLGNQTWKTYERVRVAAGRYFHHEFPAGFSAHWVRLTAGSTCTATGYFTYT